MRRLALLALLAGCERPVSELERQLGPEIHPILTRAGRDFDGLRAFLSLKSTDGAASEEYCAHLGRLLERWEEPAFLRALDSLDAPSRERVLLFLGYEYGWVEHPPSWTAFSARHPRLAHLVERR